MSVNASILDLPNEIFLTEIFKHLDDIDIYHLGETGNQRLKEISEAYVQLGKF